MSKKQYSVAIWTRDKNGQRGVEHECHTESLDFALAFAGFLYCKKLVELRCLTEGSLNVWYTNPEESSVKKLKNVYITVLDESNRDVTGPDKIVVIKGYGDESVGTFPR